LFLHSVAAPYPCRHFYRRRSAIERPLALLVMQMKDENLHEARIAIPSGLTITFALLAQVLPLFGRSSDRFQKRARQGSLRSGISKLPSGGQPSRLIG